jgi:hypothetical protein
MAVAKRKTAGAPERIIDWDIVGQKLIAGCNVTEIARFFGCVPDTLYNQCKAKNNLDFSAFRQQKKAIGDTMLREVLYDCAMAAKYDPKYIPAAIFLAKARLKMSDKPEEKKNSLQDVQITIVDASEDKPKD